MITEQPVDPGRSAGVVRATRFEGWPAAVRAEFADDRWSTDVGSTLLSADRRVRIWRIHLEPGERLGAHRHTLDYFWTALTAGRSLQHIDDGTTRLVEYAAGDTRHTDFRPGEHLVHDLENVGDTPLAFVTVEFLPAHPGRSDPTPLGASEVHP
jgi:mannose-6-phosphate isomerase-like protein (cupin superfamily)